MNCPDCQRTIPSDSLFCCYCGQSLQQCKPCELFFPAEAAFCGSCGSALSVSKPSTFEPPDDVDETTVAYLYDRNDPKIHFSLRGGDNTLGAGGNNDLVIHRPPISWNHAIFLCRNDRVLLQDSASTNGTFVNNERIRTPQKLSHDDLIRFGSEEFQIWFAPDLRA